MESAIEKAPEKILGTGEILQDLVRDIQANSGSDKKEIIKKRLQSLTKIQLDTLQSDVQKNTNIPKILSEQDSNEVLEIIKDEINNQLDQLAKNVEAKAKTSFFSRENQFTATVIGGTLLTGGIFYGLWRLFGKAKEQVQQKAVAIKGGLSWFGKMLLIGGAASLASLLGYIGIKKAKEYLKEYVDSAKQEMTDQAKKTIESAEEKAKKALEIAQNASEVTEKNSDKKPTKITPPTITPEVKKGLRDAAGDIALTHLTNITGPTVWAKMKDWKVESILDFYDPISQKVKSEKVKELTDQVMPKDTKEAESRLYTEAATEIIVTFGKNADRMKQIYEKNKKSDDPVFTEVKLSDVFGQMADDMQIFDTISKGMSNIHSLKIADMRGSIEQMNIQDKLKPLGALEIKGIELPKECTGVTYEDIIAIAEKKKNIAHTAADYLQTSKPTEELLQQLSAFDKGKSNEENEGSLKAQLALRVICESMVKSGEILSPLFHKILPDAEWDMTDNQKNISAINNILATQQVGDILRFYLYRRMMAGGEPIKQATGLIAQQVEILKVIDRMDPGTNRWFIGNIKKQRDRAIIRMGKGVADGTLQKSISNAFGITESAVEKATQYMTEPAKAAASRISGFAMEPLQKMFGTYEAAITENPTIVGGATLTAGAVVTYPLRKAAAWWYGRRNVNSLTTSMQNAHASWFMPEAWALNKMRRLDHSAQHMGGVALDNIRSSWNGTGKVKELMEHTDAWLQLGAKRAQMQTEMIAPAQKILLDIDIQIKATTNPTKLTELQSNYKALEAYITRLKQYATYDGEKEAMKAIAKRAMPVSDLLRKDLYDEAQWRMALKNSPSVTTQNVVEFLEKNKQLSAKEMALVRQSEGAKKIIVGAVNTGNAAEINRAIKAAKIGACIRVPFNAAGVVGDMFQLKMVYADFISNEGKIINTENPALISLYKSARTSQAIEGGIAATSLAINGYCFVTTLIAKEGVLAALSTPGTIAMLPIGLATAAGVYGKKHLDAASEDWLKDEKEWIKSSTPDMLLAKLKELGPGQESLFTGIAISDNFSSLDKNMQMIANANEGTRYSITRAYVIQTTELSRIEDETFTEYQKRYNNYIADQIWYIASATKGKFDTTLTDVFRNARLHAELAQASRFADVEGEGDELSSYYRGSLQDIAKQKLLNEYKNARKKNNLFFAQNAAEKPEGESTLRHLLIEETTDNIWKQKMEIDVFAGAGTPYASAINFAAQRLTENTIAVEIRRLMSLKQNISQTDYDQSVEHIRATIGTPVRELALFVKQQHLMEKVQNENSVVLSTLFTPEHLLDPQKKSTKLTSESEKTVVTIDKILKDKNLTTDGQSMNISNAAGYTFAAMKNGIILYDSVRRSSVITIPNNDPYSLPIGMYSVYKPHEKLSQTLSGDVAPGSLGTITITPKTTDNEKQIKNQINTQRFEAGKKILVDSGAKQLSGTNTFVLTYSVLDRSVDFAFDTDASEWKVVLGPWGDTAYGHNKAALAGVSPDTLNVQNMAWGNAEQYNVVIRKIAEVNRLKKFDKK